MTGTASYIQSRAGTSKSSHSDFGMGAFVEEVGEKKMFACDSVIITAHFLKCPIWKSIRPYSLFHITNRPDRVECPQRPAG